MGKLTVKQAFVNAAIRLRIAFILLLIPVFANAVPSFPGAEGFGAVSIGGRGGRAIEVTNLNDSGPGSFRDAVLQTGPRTVIFKVAGTIDLKSDVVISGTNRSYLTIAGQTAPGGGIQLRYYGLSIRDGAHDVIVRYIRHRRGWIDAINSYYYTGFVIANDSGTAPVYNIIVDHCSFGWHQDDNGTWAKVSDVTFQWNIFGEANAYTTHDGASGKGLLVGAEPGNGLQMRNISIHHNYIASNASRNPAISGYGPTELVNNVVYNWESFGTNIYSRSAEGSAVNIIGNYYKAGPNTFSIRYEMGIGEAGTYSETQPPQMVYVKDNIGPHRPSSTQSEWDIMGYLGGSTPNGEDTNGPGPESFRRSTPWPTSSFPITISSSTTNTTNVLDNVGATLPMRDAVDARLVDEYKKGTGSVGGDNNWPVLAAGTAYTDADHDGMSDDWENANGLNANDPTDSAKYAGNGYTNLENFLNGTISTPENLPDVVVTGVSYNATTGTFTSTVKNQGKAATPSGVYVGVSYSVDGVYRTWGSVMGPIAAGASVTMGTGGPAYVIPSGTHSITVLSDDAARFTESNETNNALTQPITIGGSADTAAPSVPAGLTATATSPSQVNLAWSASTDNIGVTGYRIERCQGAGCSAFAQIGTAATNSYANSGLSASTTYSYRVRAMDAAGNMSGYSSTGNSTTHATPLTVSASIPTTTFFVNTDGSKIYTTITATPSRDVTRIELSRDSYPAFLTDVAAPYEFTWCVNCFKPDEPLPRSTTLHLTAYASDGAKATTDIVVTVNLSPSDTSLPDVVVTSVSYDPATGIFTSTVKNQGTAATPPGVYVGVSYSVDGVYRTWGSVMGPLAAGASVTMGTGGGAYFIPSGTHSITVFADDAARFVESNETNNKLTQAITIK